MKIPTSVLLLAYENQKCLKKVLHVIAPFLYRENRHNFQRILASTILYMLRFSHNRSIFGIIWHSFKHNTLNRIHVLCRMRSHQLKLYFCIFESGFSFRLHYRGYRDYTRGWGKTPWMYWVF